MPRFGVAQFGIAVRNIRWILRNGQSEHRFQCCGCEGGTVPGFEPRSSTRYDEGANQPSMPLFASGMGADALSIELHRLIVTCLAAFDDRQRALARQARSMFFLAILTLRDLFFREGRGRLDQAA